MARERARLAITRSGSTDNRLNIIAYNTFKWIPTASTNQTILNFKRLLTLCFTSTRR